MQRAGAAERSRAAGAQPPYVSLAAKYLLSALKDRASYEGSKFPACAGSIPSKDGPGSLACTFKITGICATYALFIQDNAVVDARYAVETDSCETQTYTQFDLVTGVLGRPTAPVQPPLY